MRGFELRRDTTSGCDRTVPKDERKDLIYSSDAAGKVGSELTMTCKALSV